MKKLLIIAIALLAISCKQSAVEADAVVLTKEQYENLVQGNGVVKKVVTFPDVEYVAKEFEVYTASDKHEYYIHFESHEDDQWAHYIGCDLCVKRDSLRHAEIVNLLTQTKYEN